MRMWVNSERYKNNTFIWQNSNKFLLEKINKLLFLSINRHLLVMFFHHFGIPYIYACCKHSVVHAVASDGSVHVSLYINGCCRRFFFSSLLFFTCFVFLQRNCFTCGNSHKKANAKPFSRFEIDDERLSWFTIFCFVVFCMCMFNVYRTVLFSFTCTFTILLATDARQFIHTYASNHLYTLFVFHFFFTSSSSFCCFSVSLTPNVAKTKEERKKRQRRTDGKQRKASGMGTMYMLWVSESKKWIANCLTKTFQIITVIYSGRTVAFVSLPNQPIKYTQRNTRMRITRKINLCC